MKNLFYSLGLALLGFTSFAQNNIIAYSSISSLWGFMKTDGTKITECIYKNVNGSVSTGYAGFDPKTKTGIVIGIDGTTNIIDQKGLESLEFISETEKNFLVAKVSGKFGTIKPTGEFIHDAVYTKIEKGSNEVAVAAIGTQFFLLKKDGTKIEIKEPVYEIKKFTEGIAPYVSKTKQTGFINDKGEIVKAAEFESVGYFSAGFAWARVASKKIGFLDKNGVWLVEPKYDMVKEFDPTTKLALVKFGEQFLFLSTTGKEVTVEGATKLGEFQEGLAYAFKDSKVGYVDPSGKWITEAKYDKVISFVNGFSSVKIGDLWGMIDKTGREIVEPKYQDLEKMGDNGLVACKVGTSWGYLNTKGELAIPASFEAAETFKNGFAFVKKGGKWGMIDIKGTEVIGFQFIKLESF